MPDACDLEASCSVDDCGSSVATSTVTSLFKKSGDLTELGPKWLEVALPLLQFLDGGRRSDPPDELTAESPTPPSASPVDLCFLQLSVVSRHLNSLPRVQTRVALF